MHADVRKWVLPLVLVVAGLAQAQAIRREGFVTDQAEVVDQAARERIRVVLGDLLIRTAPGGVENLADSLARAWNTDGNLGLIVVVAVDDRKWRIAPASDLEGTLTDAYNNQIADRCFKPNFRAGNYGAGLVAAAEELAARIPVRAGGTTTSYPSSGGYTPPPSSRSFPGATACGGPGLCTGIGCLVAFVFVMGILNSARRWSGPWGGGGGYWSRPYGGGGWGGGWGRSYGSGRSWGGGWGGGYRSSGWSSGRSSWGSSGGGSSFRSSSSSSSSPRRTSFGGGGTSGSW